MKLTALLIILFRGFVSEGECVVYRVLPTNPIDSCPGNGSSCPLGQLCVTMDYLVEHSSKLFSSDHINVTLVFVCGIHNYTKDLTVQNLHSFVMKGATESRENVIIDHQFGTQPKCTIIQFFNISLVNITNLTIRCPAIKVKESHISVKSSTIYGYRSIKDSLSFINIIGRGSLAVLDNCKFSENCFIASNLSDGLIVSNSTFQAYRHESKSIIMAYSSEVTLSGSVNFTDSIKGFHSSNLQSGTAVFLRTTQPNLEASLTISTGATVYFVRSDKCDKWHIISLINAQGLPYCRLSREKAQKHIGMYFDPGLNETLSAVSSAPQCVCLCDSSGQPQCAKISQIFTNISVYHGETFRVSAHVVGYDFGTTVGSYSPYRIP